MTKQEEILTNILDCGTEDLKLLEDIEYDLYDIIEYLKGYDSFNINSIFREVFKKGAIDLNYAFIEHKEEIREQILEEIRTAKEEYPDYDLEKDKDYQELVNDLDLLDNEKLNPIEDLDYYLNWQDTHVYMEHIEFYRKHMLDVVDTIETNMGWEFEQRRIHMNEPKVNKYKIVDYFDVWGNPVDGWEVNDLTSYYDTDETCLRISEDATDEEIINFLILIEYLKPEAKNLVRLESQDNEFIEIVQTKNDYPIGRLEMIG